MAFEKHRLLATRPASRLSRQRAARPAGLPRKQRHATRQQPLAPRYAACASPPSRKILRVTKFHTITTAVAKIFVIR